MFEGLKKRRAKKKMVNDIKGMVKQEAFELIIGAVIVPAVGAVAKQIGNLAVKGYETIKEKKLNKTIIEEVAASRDEE